MSIVCFAQKNKVDSLKQLLKTETTDTGRVKLMWQIARDMSRYNPDSAIIAAQQALQLARKINYLEGQSRSLGILSNALTKIGNYPKALELNIEKLRLEEQRNNPTNLASVLMNIGIIYVYQDEYRKALEYYAQADSVIRQFSVDTFLFSILLNIGDAYDRLNISDSAYVHFNKSLDLAKRSGNSNRIGLSMTGLGHSFRKLGSNEKALFNYRTAIKNLKAANNDETLSEAALGLALLFEQMHRNDSAAYYGRMARVTAEKGKFLTQELRAAEFLKDHYQQSKKIDSAFFYLLRVQQINDSINSKAQIRALQIMTSNEQFRQMELEQAKIAAKKKRSKQMQLMLIGFFIPVLFLITLLLNRVKIHMTLIRLLGVLSLLFMFEYLILLLHPTVAELTHHTPVWEILIFVAMASLLIPAHHRFEQWFIHKLLHHRTHGGAVKTPHK
jgi:tetratricopeptide (TPR) repeat protein